MQLKVCLFLLILVWQNLVIAQKHRNSQSYLGVSFGAEFVPNSAIFPYLYDPTPNNQTGALLIKQSTPSFKAGLAYRLVLSKSFIFQTTCSFSNFNITISNDNKFAYDAGLFSAFYTAEFNSIKYTINAAEIDISIGKFLVSQKKYSFAILASFRTIATIKKNYEENFGQYFNNGNSLPSNYIGQSYISSVIPTFGVKLDGNYIFKNKKVILNLNIPINYFPNSLVKYNEAMVNMSSTPFAKNNILPLSFGINIGLFYAL